MPRDYEVFLLVLLVLMIPLAGGLYAVIRFLAALQRVLRRVQPDHRRIEPGYVYLNLIPVFNLVWATATVVLVAESLRNEYRARGLDSPAEDYGRSLGLTLLTLLATGCLFYPAFFTYPVALWVWVRYWGRVNRHARELKTGEVPGAAVPAAAEDEGW